MLKKLSIIFVFCVFVGLMSARAQFDSLNYAINGENYFFSRNASLINGLNINTISLCEISLNLEKGGFKNYYQADKSLMPGAKAESFYRFNPKVSGYGKMSYSNFYGEGISGSAFVDPENVPFDIVEQNAENSGVKNLETYDIVGAIAVEVFNNFSLGAKLDYTAANYAKRKDLRHKNSFMDMMFSLGLSYQGSFFTTGADCFYNRKNQRLKFLTFGTTDKTYNSIISYGAFWGLREEFGTEGFTDRMKEMPLSDVVEGFNYQLLIKITENLKWFNDISLSWRSGNYGEKNQYSVQYEKHDAKIYSLSGSLFLTKNKFTHSFNYQAEKEELNVFKNIFKTETFDGGLTDYIYYDKLRISQRDFRVLKLVYNCLLFSNLNEKKQVWDFGISGAFSNRNLVAVKYPFWRHQDLTTKQIDVSLSEKNCLSEEKEITFRIGGGLKKGSGYPYIDGWYLEPDIQNVSPSQSDVFLNMEYEYLCKPQLNLNFAVKYSQKIFSDRIKAYISVDYEYLRAKNTVYLSKERNFCVLRVGAEF